MVVGLVAGAASGMFGIGGGPLIVPGLMMVAKLGQRSAHGTSLAAVVPIAVAGGTGYLGGGAVDAVALVPLALGSVVGAELGSRLLARAPERTLRLAFAGLLIVVAVQLVLDPTGATSTGVAVGPASLAGLVTLGLVTGAAAGLLGVGGGLVVVPGLILAFGVTDVVAKGTSLLLILPTAVVGTIGNVRRGNADLELAVWVGTGGIVTAYATSQLALRLDPAVTVPLFAAFLVVIGLRILWQARSGTP